MSIESVAKALNINGGLSATEKLVLIGIANHDGDGGAWPSIATLARYANCAPRSARRCVRRLEQLGLVETTKNAGGTKDTADDRRPNLYRLRIQQVVDNPVDGGTGESPRDATGGPGSPPGGDQGVQNGGTGESPEPSNEPSMNRALHPSDDVSGLEDLPDGKLKDRITAAVERGSRHTP